MNKSEWKSIKEQPVVSRGECIECWVAILFEPRNYAAQPKGYHPAEKKVIRLSWLNASLTDKELECWEEDGELPEECPGALDYWTNVDGEHSNFTGWVGFLDDGEGGYIPLSVGDDGYVPDGYMVGRFKMLAWRPNTRPEFPAELEGYQK